MKNKSERKKFPYLQSAEELDSTPEADTGYFVSPGGAASSLGVDRAHIRNLEARGHISGYRIHHPRYWLPRLLTSKPGYEGDDYIFISVASLRAYAKRVGRELQGPVGPGPNMDNQ